MNTFFSNKLPLLKDVMPNSKNRWAYAVLVIVLLSIKIISVAFSTSYNSDVALHVLMIDRFEFLVDNYIWGETYLGSLFPLVGSVIKDIFGFESLHIALFLQYLCLLVTYLYSIHLFVSNKYLRILLAVALFFPPISFINLVSVGYSFLSSFPPFFISVHYLFRFFEKSEQNPENSHYSLLWYFFFSFLACWVLEYFYYLNFITSVLLVVFLFYRKRTFYGLNTIIILLSNVTIVFLRSFLKSNNRSQFFNESYSKINNLSEVISTIKIYSNIYIAKLLSFDVYSILTFVSIIFLAYTVILDIRKNKKDSKFLNLRTLFLAYLLSSYLWATFLSNWTLVQGELGVRYFSASYYFYVLLLFNVLDHYLKDLKSNYEKIFLFSLLGIYIISGGVALVYKYYTLPYKNASAYDINKQLKKYGINDKLFLAGYWESYLLSAASSSTASATVSSYDSFVKYRDEVSKMKVVEGKDIYIVKNRLFDNFPDSVLDYGFKYIKTKDLPIVINYEEKLYIQHYKNASYDGNKLTKILGNKGIHSWVGSEITDSVLNSNVWKVDLDKLSQNSEIIHIFTPIGRGGYEFRAKINISNATILKNNLMLRVADNMDPTSAIQLEIPRDSLISGYKVYNGSVMVLEDMNAGIIQIFGEKTEQKCEFRIAEFELIRND